MTILDQEMEFHETTGYIGPLRTKMARGWVIGGLIAAFIIGGAAHGADLPPAKAPPEKWCDLSKFEVSWKGPEGLRDLGYAFGMTQLKKDEAAIALDNTVQKVAAELRKWCADPKNLIEDEDGPAKK